MGGKRGEPSDLFRLITEPYQRGQQKKRLAAV